MASEIVNHVVIVGGGTAGWLTAANLAKRLDSGSEGAVKVTLVESPDIKTIGVGEGTWPTMRKTLSNIGLDEGEFMRTCHATFKQGTKFVNWKNAPAGKPGTGNDIAYYNLFSSIYDPADFNLGPYWALGLAGEERAYADAVSTQGEVCKLGLAPKKITTKAYDGLQSYAYHLDAGKFAELIRDHAVNNLGVNHLLANVKHVKQDADGFIVAIETDAHGTIEGDFFVDCTGFKCLLLGETLGIPFHSIGDRLLTDYAVTIQAPYETEDTPIPCTTISTAQTAGWIWDISLSSRRGTGYVYSSKHIDHEEAEKTLREYIGEKAEGLDARKIKMDIGYREKFWHKNCLAIGLSAAFVEPLEASAIFLIEAASNMLADQFPRSRHLMPLVEKKFNESFTFRWQKTIDFLKMHYYLSQRSDSDFWRDNKDLSTVPDSLLASLEHWKHHPISQYDFAHVYEPFPQESYQFILYGMGFKQDLQYNASSFAMREKAKEYFSNVQKYSSQIVKELPTHRELINKVYQYGFQAV